MGAPEGGGSAAFALVYLTFFLDNVLLTVLVPIIPDWVRGDGVREWAAHALLLNGSAPQTDAQTSMSPAVSGMVLSGKAVAQLALAAPAAAAVGRAGPVPVLRAATAMLAVAAIVLSLSGGPWWLFIGRGCQGAGAAGAGVAGVSLAARALPPAIRDRALGALLGAVALGVLVGYPFGGAAYALWSPQAPFLVIAAALLADLALQYTYLNKDDYNIPCGAVGARWWSVLAAARRGAAGACAGAVLLTTAVMAALEPCLPVWVSDTFHTEVWQRGVAFVPDSLGYLLCASCLGGVARAVGAERVALAGQAVVAGAALVLPYAKTVWWVMVPQALLGAGLGATDAALVPALLARHPRRVPAVAALLQSASSVAYVAGPVLGGAVASAAGFGAALRALATLNLIYLPLLYRRLRETPLSTQWGAGTPDSDSEDEAESAGQPLRPGQYAAMN